MDMTLMSPEELEDLAAQIQAEKLRRQNIAMVDEQVGEVLSQARDAGVTDEKGEGEQWRQPLTAADAYLAGDVVSYEGAEWTSTLNGNVWSPKVSGWRKTPDGGKPAEFRQPTGAHDAYRRGEKVTVGGKTYTSIVDFNVWSPQEFPRGWVEVDTSDEPDGEQNDDGEADEEPDTEGTEDASDSPSVAERWRPGLTVTVGQTIDYDGKLFTVRQPHTTQAGWEPPVVPALYSPA